VRKNLTPDDLGGLLNQPRCAVLATNYADGTTLLSPVWHEWRDGGFTIVIFDNDAKARHIRRDPRVSVVVADDVPPLAGIEVRACAQVSSSLINVAVPKGPAETKHTVLVVDDDQRLRHLVEVVLQNNGFKVEFADDGDALLPMVRRHRPDVVLLDLKMARMSGIEALQGLRSAGEDLGVIILSAAGEEALVLAAFEAGADDYVTKPFMIRVLLARLRAVLKRSARKEAEAGGDNEASGVTLEPLTHNASVEGRRESLSPKEYE